MERADMLEAAYAASLCVLGAYDDGRLIGIVRAVGDGNTILLIQDVLVLPAYQRQGIGTRLIKTLMAKYKGVYQTQLLTDNTPKTIAFYRSLGFSRVEELGCRAFIKN